MSLAVHAIAWQSAKSTAWTPLIRMMRKQNHIKLAEAARKNRLVTAGNLRQGSKELDSSYSTERSSPFMLSAAKQRDASLPIATDPSLSLRVTRCDCSNCQAQFGRIEPCLTQKEGGPFCGTTLFSHFAKLLPLAIRHGRTLFNLRLLHFLLITALFHVGRAC
jgi:hypothetical protein